MYEQPAAGSSTVRQVGISKIAGSVPGLLDPTQAGRLCREPGSKLCFASFDPHTASSLQETPDIRKLSLNEELYRPKRVVIETTVSGESFWRFVPSARRDEGVLDEGRWPRVIEICGELFECSQDQWDIYKLDPVYDCHIRSYPNLTVISRNEANSNSIPTTKIGNKRHASPPTPDGTTRAPNAKKKVHEVEELDSDEGEESEVEEMIIDDDKPRFQRPRSAGPSDRLKRFKEEIERNRKARREKFVKRAERLTKEDNELSLVDPDRPKSVPPTPPTPEISGKRKVNSLFDSLRSNGDPDPGHPPVMEDETLRNTMNYVRSKQAKRTRTVSPTSAKRDLEAKRLAREKQKRERREQELHARRQERDTQFLREVYNEIPELDMIDASQGPQGTQEKEDSKPNVNTDQISDNTVTEEAVRQAAIAESRRKIAELEADRPLWEAVAAKRREKEREEELARQARVEAQKYAALRAEQEERRRREEAEKKARDEAAQREREVKARQEKAKHHRQSWLYGKWSQQRAMERYIELSRVFDETKFSPQEPLTTDAVPWPVLQSPNRFSVEDVTWQAVEQFFDAFKSRMRTQDFKVLVEKSHRRFHPDRWRSRSLLTSVVDQFERECMEVAANTVAQALTPIWQELKAAGRS